MVVQFCAVEKWKLIHLDAVKDNMTEDSFSSEHFPSCLSTPVTCL